jgi:hypothetical protein
VILALLRSLDPEESEEQVRHRAGRGGGADSDEEGAFEPSFDFFALFQATYKLRTYYRRHSDADPFSKSAPQGIYALLGAVRLQPALTSEAKIGRYVQLAEILDVVEEFEHSFASGADELANRLRDELSELEPVIEAMLRASEAFCGLFGVPPGEHKASRFLGWFRGELKKRHATGASDVAS